MTCELATCFQDVEVGCLPTLSSDMNQSLALTSIHTVAKCCGNEQQKDGSQALKSLKGTSDTLMQLGTLDGWMSSMQDSLANLIQSPVFKQVLATREAAKCGAKQNASLTSLDLDTFTWRTCQDLFDKHSQESQPTFPESGMTLNGYLYQLPSLGLIINDGDGGGLLPTPSGTSNHGKNHVSGRLDEWGGSSNPWRGTEIGKVHCAAFEEWMQGLPIMWTALTEYETLKYPCKPQLLGSSLEANK